MASAQVPQTVRVGVVGVSGYTGLELMRLLHGHPHVRVTACVGDSSAGETLANIAPSLGFVYPITIEALDVAALKERCDAVFVALPHGASQRVVAQLYAAGLRVFDLSADFRLRDAATYARYYGDHAHPELLAKAVYGLVELHRTELATADLVAVPGCYPTTSILALAPLLKQRAVDPATIIIDAKSGVTGAGRKAAVKNLFAEVSEGFRAYQVGGVHRHISEIEQELSAVAGATIHVSFAPHLVPMRRGILATCYATLASASISAEALTQHAAEFYAASPLVHVLPAGTCPDTAWVRGSGRAALSFTIDGRTRRVIAQCVIDNLGKGASAQAIQCLNLRFGWPDDTGLAQLGVVP